MGATIYWVAAEIDTQPTIFNLSTLKKQLLICNQSNAINTDLNDLRDVK
jgi:hypothetical protein